MINLEVLNPVADAKPVEKRKVSLKSDRRRNKT
jgi:hypothetical protein